MALSVYPNYCERSRLDLCARLNPVAATKYHHLPSSPSSSDRVVVPDWDD